jgi:hypothetical protein
MPDIYENYNTSLILRDFDFYQSFLYHVPRKTPDWVAAGMSSLWLSKSGEGGEEAEKLCLRSTHQYWKPKPSAWFGEWMASCIVKTLGRICDVHTPAWNAGAQILSLKKLGTAQITKF